MVDLKFVVCSLLFAFFMSFQNEVCLLSNKQSDGNVDLTRCEQDGLTRALWPKKRSKQERFPRDCDRLATLFTESHVTTSCVHFLNLPHNCLFKHLRLRYSLSWP